MTSALPDQAQDTFEPIKLTKSQETVSVAPELQVVDLFCGAGGLSVGLELAGFQTIAGVDCWEPACATFADNHLTSSVFEADLSVFSVETLLNEVRIDVGELGLVCGGPPCQGFSVAGRSLADDPRNLLYKHFLELVADLQPKWVIMENVPALLKNESVANAIHNDFHDIRLPGKIHYELYHKVINSADFGVPQTRTRVIFIAKRSDLKLKADQDIGDIFRPIFSNTPSLFGEPSYVTADEAISDLPLIYAGQGAEVLDYDRKPTTKYQALMRGQLTAIEFFRSKGIDVPDFCGSFRDSEKVFNHLAQNHSELLIERFDNIPPGGSKEDLRRNRPDLLPPEGHAEQGLTYGRLWADRPATTIPANYSRPSGNRSIHPHVPRLITPREAMRLSSFPDSHRLIGGKGAQREQVGNAVTPLLAFHIGRKLRELSN